MWLDVSGFPVICFVVSVGGGSELVAVITVAIANGIQVEIWPCTSVLFWFIEVDAVRLYFEMIAGFVSLPTY